MPGALRRRDRRQLLRPCFQRHLDFFRFVAALDGELHLFADLLGREVVGEFLEFLDRLAVDGRHDVVGLEAGAGRRTVFGDRRELRSFLGVFPLHTHVRSWGLAAARAIAAAGSAALWRPGFQRHRDLVRSLPRLICQLHLVADLLLAVILRELLVADDRLAVHLR